MRPSEAGASREPIGRPAEALLECYRDLFERASRIRSPSKPPAPTAGELESFRVKTQVLLGPAGRPPDPAR